ncbi:MAG: MarR family winged helix-turn-helix transcriptional regulator [Nitrososphaerales archaeon]
MTERDELSQDARDVWARLCDLVLDNERRKEVSEAVGLSFGRVKAVRRLARQPMPMGELASALGIDAPYATVMVDDLESLGLVRRRPHPTDRRAKIVEVTRRGKAAAQRADVILSTPPPGLCNLDPHDLEEFARVLRQVTRADVPRLSPPGADAGAPKASAPISTERKKK